MIALARHRPGRSIVTTPFSNWLIARQVLTVRYVSGQIRASLARPGVARSGVPRFVRPLPLHPSATPRSSTERVALGRRARTPPLNATFEPYPVSSSPTELPNRPADQPDPGVGEVVSLLATPEAERSPALTVDREPELMTPAPTTQPVDDRGDRVMPAAHPEPPGPPAVRQDEQAEPNMAEALERFPLTVEPWVEDPPGPSTVLEDPHPAVTPAAASDIPANSVLPETAVEQPNQAPGTPETSPAPVPLASDATDRVPPDFPTTTHLTTAMSERDAPADTATEARVTMGDRDADTNGAPHIPPPDMPLDVPLSAGPNLSAPVRLDGTTKQRHGSDDDATRTMTDSGFSVAPPGADADRLSTSVGVEGSDGTEMAEDQPRPAASPEIEDAMPAEPAPEQNEPNVVYAIGSSVPPPVTQPAGHDAVESPSNVHEVQDVMAPVTALSEVADTVAESRTEQLSDRAEAPVGAPPVHEVRYVPRPRLAPRPEPPAPLASDVDDLFADNGEDRSPQAWLARLRRAARAEAGLPPDNEETKSSLSHAPELESPPSPVSLQDYRRSVTHVEVPLSARRFLAPRLGIDPASVEILAGPLAANVVDAHDSDAIAIGDTVILGNEPGEAPAQLGLLAHELTHVARHRASRFVPPIVAADRPPQSLRGSTERDDEELAQRVEALVRSEAQAMSDPSIADPDQEPSGITSDARTSWSEAVSEQLRRPDAENGHSNWGGLPAPWEPLPAWLTEPGPELDLTSSEAQPTAGDAPTTSWQASETPARTARQDRSLQTETPHAEAHANDPRTANAEPDLDELAHQVYRVLKRRLAAEARRSQVSG